MKRYSKEELQEKGKAIANSHQVDKLFATDDGQFFLPSKHNAAELHKRVADVELYELNYTEAVELTPEAVPELTPEAVPELTPEDQKQAPKPTKNK